jgi:glycosyltransferase involved in cell wall biosynthesis
MRKIKKINLLLLHPTGEIGGTEQYLLSLAKVLPKERYDITICFWLHGGQIAEEMRRDGLQVEVLNLKNGFDLWGMRKLYYLIKTKKIDILHSHAPDVLARIVAGLARVPIQINTDHGPSLYAESPRRFRQRVLNFILNPLTDRFIAISQIMKTTLIQKYRVPVHKIVLIYNGISLNSHATSIDKKKKKAELGCPDGTPIIITIGRATEQKRFDLLLDAFRIVKDKFNKEIIMLLVGDGPLKKQLEEKSEELGLYPSLRFLGFRRDIPELLAIADIFVTSSQWEGFSIVLLEAMEAQKAIVGFDVDGVNEAVVDGKNGYLVPFPDTRSLAQKIIHLLDNPDKAIRMGKEGCQRVKNNFSIEVHARKLATLYEQLLAEKG